LIQPRTDIFVSQFVRQPDALRLVLHRLAVHDRRLELFCYAPVNGIALCVFQSLSALRVVAAREIRPAEGANATIPGAPFGTQPTKSSTVHLVERSTTGAE
jgi:hypothetical protein